MLYFSLFSCLLALSFAPRNALALAPSAKSVQHRTFMDSILGLATRPTAAWIQDFNLARQGLGLRAPGGKKKRSLTIGSLSTSGNYSCKLQKKDSNDAANSGDSGDSGGDAGSGSEYQLVANHTGQGFFDGFAFYNVSDSRSTKGIVNYLLEDDARAAGIIEINDSGNALLKIDTTPKIEGNRSSVRISSLKTYTKGIFILDAVHMPQGCGTWPSYWTNGYSWPTRGEIDIIEGVNNYTVNQASIHTDIGCSLPSDASSSTLNVSATLISVTNCAAKQTDDAGCSWRDSSNSSFGSGFNNAGGGVYAKVWTDDEIAIYFFPRGSIPDDITNDAPQPANWGQPQARWPSTNCDISKYFYSHWVIIDTTLCGLWAGDGWNATGVTGQEQSCAARTGYSTCEDFVRNEGASFGEAYWEISYMKVFQTSPQS